MMAMLIEFVSKATPVPNGCCGVEFPQDAEKLHELLRALEEATGRKWVATMTVYEDLSGNRLVVHHFPRNLRRAERAGVKELPAVLVDGKPIVEGEENYSRVVERLRSVLKG